MIKRFVSRTLRVALRKNLRDEKMIAEVTEKYRKLVKVPSIESGRLTSDQSVSIRYSQTNLDAERRTRFSIDYNFDFDSLKIQSRSFPIDIQTENIVKQSPSGKCTAIVRTLTINKEPRQFLEIWTRNELFSSVDLKALDVHGNIYLNDCVFGSFQWSSDEQKLAYIAEKKKPVCEPFYKRKAAVATTKEPEALKGEEYVFEQTWGEQTDDKRKSIIAVYNVASETIEIVSGFDYDRLFPAQIVWGPDDSCLIGVAFHLEPRKLGIVYCTNRPNELFQIDFNGNYVKLSERNECFLSPAFTPDFKYLIWLERKLDGPHLSCMRLMKMLYCGRPCENDEIIGMVDHKIKTANGYDFYGLYNWMFEQRIWLSDNRKLVFSTSQEYRQKCYVVDIESKELHELIFNGNEEITRSHSFLDCFNDFLLIASQQMFTYDNFLIGEIDLETYQVRKWLALDEKPRPIPSLENYTCDILRMNAVDEEDSIRHFNAIYIHPKTSAKKSVPLIVMPHGGPHSYCSIISQIHINLLANLNFAMVLVNYRGSIGAGQQSIEFLTRNVNRSDIADCMMSLEKCMETDTGLDPESVYLWGGSYGGFLVAHLSARFPLKFKAVVATNPVIDIASMSLTSDIPDWCYAESNRNYFADKTVDDNLLLKMRHLSPIGNLEKIVTPTLLLLGTKDFRVPHFQGLHYYYALKERGIKTKALLYDDCHNLLAVNNKMDSVINGAMWLLANQ